MKAFESKLQPLSTTFLANSEEMLEKIAEFRGLEQKVRALSASKRARFEKRGQLLPRERLMNLVDRGTPLLELSTLAGLGMHDDDGEENVMGGGSIVAIGTVSGKRVLIFVSDSGIKGGTVAPMGLKKTLRAQEIVAAWSLPVIYLVESGGANLLYQSELFVEGGKSFANQARLSAAGIPQVAVVHGSSTAGGAYLPALSDYVILVEGRSKVFLAGPPLVKAAIGEDATEEELGGARLHVEQTGLGDYLAHDDKHALAIARNLFTRIGWPAVDEGETAPPCFAAEELLGIVPVNNAEPYDVREVIARIVDESKFLEFKANYGSETICAHVEIGGHQLGILGNNGPIQPAGSTKAAQFIQLCNQSEIPLLFLQNTTGFMVGKEAEQAGAIKHGAKMIQAVANARVPKLVVVIGGSYGAGNYGMCGRGFDPSFIFSWPTARTAVMGGAQAAKVMALVMAGKMKRMGQSADDETLAAWTAPIEKQLNEEAHVLFGTARLWDDGVIDPRDTRRVLRLCLDVIKESKTRNPKPNTFGVARL
ncbi:MAG: acyl-CoA carboxylase subunit beta [Deltaproteobacteria bacterium]|nr:acyl-CoA carboxylase subunit beta [Deltaproteobacteria bacterium]